MADWGRLRSELETLVVEAGKIARDSRKKLSRELKPDGSIVTNADVAVEDFLTPHLQDLVPGSSVWGEEHGFSESPAQSLWLVDPIDGTSNYAFGSPLWGVSIALLHGDDLVAGVISLPDLGEVYSAHFGGGATLDGEPLEPIPPGAIRDEELVSYGELVLQLYPPNSLPGKNRYAGAFVVDAAWVATQRYRGLIGFKGMLYDFGAGILICKELGAEVRYADGRPFVLRELVDGEKLSDPFLIFPADNGFVLRPSG